MNYKSLTFLIIACILICCSGKKDLEFTILFNDAQGVKVGEKVMWKGLRIGEVHDIKLHKGGGIGFKVRIDPAFRDTVREKSAFIIKKPLINLTGEVFVEMKLLDPNSPKIQPGSIINGYDSEWDLWLEKGSSKIKELSDMLTKEGENFFDLLEEISESEETTTMKRQIAKLADQVSDVGGKGIDITKEKVSSLSEEVDRLYKDLEQQGKIEEAKKLRDQFKEFIGSLNIESN